MYMISLLQLIDRLLLQQLGVPGESFQNAARELLEWCSDVRAFQPHFEQRLLGCLLVSFVAIFTLLSVLKSKRGFHQGYPVIDDMILQFDPDIFLLQEHWLTPANLQKFDSQFTNYFSFGCSAMSSAVGAGMLRGRPYGGVMCLIKNSLRSSTNVVYCSDRYAIIKIGDCILINVYLPCIGSVNRELVCDDLIAEIDAWCQRYSD